MQVLYRAQWVAEKAAQLSGPRSGHFVCNVIALPWHLPLRKGSTLLGQCHLEFALLDMGLLIGMRQFSLVLLRAMSLPYGPFCNHCVRIHQILWDQSWPRYEGVLSNTLQRRATAALLILSTVVESVGFQEIKIWKFDPFLFDVQILDELFQPSTPPFLHI